MIFKKRAVLALTIAVLAACCFSAFGFKTASADAIYDNKNFFVSEDNNVAVTKTTDDGIYFSAVGGQFNMTYVQPIPVSSLTTENDFLSMRLIPDTQTSANSGGALDSIAGQSLVVTLTDSEDDTQQLSYILYFVELWGECKSKLTYALTDKVSDKNNSIYAGDALTVGKNDSNKIVNDFPCTFEYGLKLFWANDSYDAGFRFDFANKKTQVDSPAYGAHPVCSMPLADETFLSLSRRGMTDADLAKRYTAEHVNNLFSSGKVILSVAGYKLKDASFDFKITALGGQDFSEGYQIQNYTPPVLTQKGEIGLYEDISYNLLSFINVSAVDPAPVVDVKITENGVPLNGADFSAFIPERGKTYSFTYTATDKGGLSSSLTLETTAAALQLNIGDIVNLGLSEQQLPLPTLPDSWGYSVAIFAASDTMRQTPITTITALGDYVAVYRLYSEETGPVVVERAFKAADATAPSFTEAPNYCGNAANGAYYAYSEISVIEPKARDNFYADFEWLAKVYFGESEILLNNGKFIVQEPGVYEVRYVLKDESQNEAEYSYYFEVVENTLRPTLEISEKYNAEYTVGEKIVVAKASAHSANGNELEVHISYKLGENGEETVITAGQTLELTQAGRHYITYVATDRSGIIGKRVVTFEVKETKKTGGCNGCGGAITGIGALSLLLVAAGVAVFVCRRKSRGTGKGDRI